MLESANFTDFPWLDKGLQNELSAKEEKEKILSCIFKEEIDSASLTWKGRLFIAEQLTHPLRLLIQRIPVSLVSWEWTGQKATGAERQDGIMLPSRDGEMLGILGDCPEIQVKKCDKMSEMEVPTC